mgnify:CR=1 FL=1
MRDDGSQPRAGRRDPHDSFAKLMTQAKKQSLILQMHIAYKNIDVH